MSHPYTIALLPGDGIGTEVVAHARRVLETVAKLDDLTLTFDEISGGAQYFLSHGRDWPAGSEQHCAAADAIILGAVGMFEPIHGSAPKHVGQDRVNPIATVLAAAEALKWLSGRRCDGALASAGERVDRAVAEVLRTGETLTYDLVGPDRAASGSAVTDAVVHELMRDR